MAVGINYHKFRGLLQFWSSEVQRVFQKWRDKNQAVDRRRISGRRCFPTISSVYRLPTILLESLLPSWVPLFPHLCLFLCPFSFPHLSFKDSTDYMGDGAVVKESACQCRRCKRVLSLGRKYILEWEKATHPSILAWRIPWTEKPGGLQSMGSQRVRHDWVHTYMDYIGTTQIM